MWVPPFVSYGTYFGVDMLKIQKKEPNVDMIVAIIFT